MKITRNNVCSLVNVLSQVKIAHLEKESVIALSKLKGMLDSEIEGYERIKNNIISNVDMISIEGDPAYDAELNRKALPLIEIFYFEEVEISGLGCLSSETLESIVSKMCENSQDGQSYTLAISALMYRFLLKGGF